MDTAEPCGLQQPIVPPHVPLCTQEAEQLIQGRNLRLTRGRALVLAELLRQSRPVSHGELFAQFLTENVYMDRVTLYRILDWLIKGSLAYRLSGQDRVWRFGYSGKRDDHMHAHFHCTQCGDCSFLPEVPVPSGIHLPAGCSQSDIDVTVTGVCQRCAS